jgi:hypothetical protein
VARRATRGIGVLATIGSVSLFVGLFGTMWGVMNSFVTNIIERYYYDSLYPAHIIVGSGHAALFTLAAKL